MPDAVIGSELEGRIVFANTHAAKLFGYSIDELRALRIDDLIPQDVAEQHEFNRRESFASRPSRPMHTGLELRGLRGDGSEFPADISLSWLRRPSGDIAVTVVRDISGQRNELAERARLEEELRNNQARRLESVGKLARGVAKDFNNQLGVILNHSQVLKNALSDRPDLAEDAVRIEQAAQHSAELTKQLLVFSQSGVRYPRNDDANELLSSLVDEFESRVGEKVELQMRLADDLWRTSTDASRFRECILGIVDNAAEAIDGPGVVEITTENIELAESSARTHPGLEVPGRYIRIDVSDTGEGMEPEVRERIFEPYFTTKDSASHAGMGLATIYGSVRQADGGIYVNSQPGVGTSVSVYMKAVTNPDAVDSQADETTTDEPSVTS